MKILTAEFVQSVGADGILPGDDCPVVALIGRSNVGKSTLVNALVRRRIARAGRTPGTTRLLNVYRVRISTGATGRLGLTLVDLPGYGYARGGAPSRRAFDACTQAFFGSQVAARNDQERRTHSARLAGAVMALDARHPGLASDLAAREWVRDQRIPLIVVVTKTDRLTRAALRTATREHEAAVGSPVVVVSSKTGAGIEILWRAIIDLL